MNRKRYRNSLRLPLVAALVVVTVFCVSIALSLVQSRNSIHALSEEQRQIEHEMRLLNQEITALDRRIDGLLTRDRVQPRLASAGTLLQKINNQHVIYLTPSPSEAPAETSLNTP